MGTSEYHHQQSGTDDDTPQGLLKVAVDAYEALEPPVDVFALYGQRLTAGQAFDGSRFLLPPGCERGPVAAGAVYRHDPGVSLAASASRQTAGYTSVIVDAQQYQVSNGFVH